MSAVISNNQSAKSLLLTVMDIFCIITYYQLISYYDMYTETVRSN